MGRRTLPPSKRSRKRSRRTNHANEVPKLDTKQVSTTPGKDKSGLFTRGNRWWRQRSSSGIKPKFTDPEEFLKACEEYFEFVQDHPMYEQRLAGMYYGRPVKVSMPKLRPMTIGGLLVFLGITPATWARYKNGEHRTLEKAADFQKVCQYVDLVCREQKFAGAASGFFNHAIIARDLGLVDRQDVTSGDEPIENKTVVILPAKEDVS